MCSDKWALYEHFTRGGIPTIPTSRVSIESEAPAFGWPRVLKLRLGAGSQAMQLVASPADWERATSHYDRSNRCTQAIAQPFIHGRSLSVGAIVDRSGAVQLLPFADQWIDPERGFAYLGGRIPSVGSVHETTRPHSSDRDTTEARRHGDRPLFPKPEPTGTWISGLVGSVSQPSSLPDFSVPPCLRGSDFTDIQTDSTEVERTPMSVPSGPGGPDYVLAYQFVRDALSTIPGLFGYVGVDLLIPESPWDRLPLIVEINPRLTTSYVGYQQLCLDNLAAMWVGEEPHSTVPLWRPGEVEFNSAGEFS